MADIRKKFKALSMKDSLDVFLTIYAGCKIEYYVGFNDISRKLGIKYNTLRRITNALVRGGLISSMKKPYSLDGRERVYVVCDKDFADKILDIANPS